MLVAERRARPHVEAGFVSDAAKLVAPKLLGPLETPAEVAALCRQYPAQCAAAAQGALILGAGYLVYEAIFGAEAGPLPPPPGGRCEGDAAEPDPPETSNDPCSTESAVDCLPRAYRHAL